MGKSLRTQTLDKQSHEYNFIFVVSPPTYNTENQYLQFLASFNIVLGGRWIKNTFLKGIGVLFQTSVVNHKYNSSHCISVQRTFVLQSKLLQFHDSSLVARILSVGLNLDSSSQMPLSLTTLITQLKEILLLLKITLSTSNEFPNTFTSITSLTLLLLGLYLFSSDIEHKRNRSDMPRLLEDAKMTRFLSGIGLKYKRIPVQKYYNKLYLLPSD